MRNILVLCTLLLFAACSDSNLDILLPYEGNKLVLFSELAPNQKIQLQVERIYPPTGEVLFDKEYLNTVQALLIENGLTVDTLVRSAENNYFVSENNFQIKEGNKYQFKVSANGFIEAISEVELIPKSVKIIKAELLKEYVKSPLNSYIPAKVLEINFESNLPNKGYFLTEIVGYYNGIATSSAIMPAKISSEFGDPCVYDFSSKFILFNWDCYNKKENTISFLIELNGTVQDLNTGNQDLDELRIKVSNVNPFYYEYVSNYSQPDDIFLAFETPKPTVTNVINGYGAVLGKNQQEIRVKVPPIDK